MAKSVDQLKGVGESVAKKLKQLGIETVDDLIWNFPRKYQDYSQILPVSQLRPGQVSLRAKVTQAHGRYTRRGFHITEAIASDGSGSVRLVWFNQPYRAKAITPDGEYFISGDFELSNQRLAIMNPSMELVKDFPVSTARIIPVYKETKGLKSHVIRKLLSGLRSDIENIPEILPADVVAKHELMSRGQALMAIHFPDDSTQLEKARHRLGFEEIFGLSMAALINKKENQSSKALKIDFDQKLAKQFVSRLPFELTDAQRKTVWQIYKDMAKTTPMNRLVEGDVGSGKTVVAAMAAIMVMKKSKQVALMAPTEIIARQHAQNLHDMLKPLNMSDQVLLLLGSMKPSEKQRARSHIKDGQAKLIVGTHAVLSSSVDMHSLGLAIVDEQHRFGVEQRKLLQKKAGHAAHTLTMTATPIPRTLTLTLYGELDVSLLNQMPKGRKSVKTSIILPGHRKSAYHDADRQIEAGRQMFVVCPKISMEYQAGFAERSVEKVYKELSRDIFKHRKVGLLHGQLEADKKENIMRKFVDGKIDILVSTTVVEVGVDVPNATIMMIEAPERFGLAQVHQLRGRVGRGQHPGVCYLMMSDNIPPSKRLRVLERSSNGFELADLDLQLRGPGAIYGRTQHGRLDLRIASLDDTRLIAAARQSARKFIDSGQSLEDYPELLGSVSDYRSITTLN